MKTLLHPLQELKEYNQVRKLLEEKKDSIGLVGCVDSQKLHVLYGIGESFSNKLLITYSEKRAKEIYEDALFYDKNTVIFPAKDLIFYQADVHGNQIIEERMKCYRKILEEQPFTMVTTFSALMTSQIPLNLLKESCIRIIKGSMIQEEAIASKLVQMGYEKTHQVEQKGEFSIRGGIIDVFDLTEENPFRIELWGDEVESIRTFDILSQRSIEMKEELVLYPATEMILSKQELQEGLKKIEEDSNIVEEELRKKFLTQEAQRVKKNFQQLQEEIIEFQSYLNLDSYIRYFYEDTSSVIGLFSKEMTIVGVDEPNRVQEHGNAVELEFRESMMQRLEQGYILPKQMDILYSVEEIAAKMSNHALLGLSAFETKVSFLKLSEKFDLAAKSVPSYQGSFESLCKDLDHYKKNKYTILVVSASRTRAKRLAEDLTQQGLVTFYGEDMNRIMEPCEIMTCHGRIQKGFEYPLLKFVVISESDIFGATIQKKKKKKKYSGKKIQDFAELSVGDYVVHEEHGLGIYCGIEKVEIDHVVRDYMKIEYAGGSNLFVLATGLESVQKYASATAKKPKLNKLGTKEWSVTKSKVRGNVEIVAKELVALYAARQEKKGYMYAKDTSWQAEFEELFPYQETDDQMSAIDATKKDMESTKIMDRLICGDVGYGKTEIALRAAFKAVQEGKQVAYLVPTTLLAQQHYNTFAQRMKNFPVRVELLSRFRTAAQIRESLKGVKDGRVDIIIGTHRLLSKDVSFANLGLLIVDEEQRFGVKHKEKVKQLKENVDVLTLTATPIPRTLHMSLIGIRDMSVLEEAPNERLPVQTYVMEYNDEMIREAIVRELSRNGQVFYVCNRINQIADVTNRLQELVPEAVVVYAHGQMQERELEKLMYQFMNGEIDVFVSTTIIETGLDISNANTIIIQDSDKFGLSQLYQLRGRVGRSHRRAYAFLMYKRDTVLREVAEKRLQAIREFTELGSGFKIAMRDLEIRGAGNLLGMKQHGHMEAVGYELYCKMLNDAVVKLKGEEEVLDFTTMVDVDIDAYIPNEYILNELQKLDIYKRIAGIENEVECNEIREELLDRFGGIPESAENLIRVSLIRVEAHKIYLTGIYGTKDHIKFNFHEQAQIKVECVPQLLLEYKGKLTFHTKEIPYLLYKIDTKSVKYQRKEWLLQELEKLINSMKILDYSYYSNN
ncbi:MAG: transcription-repair coupling factor [Eubacteriales bacterium]